MMAAFRVCAILSGKWLGSYGVAPCPVCQADQRKDQNALSIRDGEGILLLHCFKNGCCFQDILAASGLVPEKYSTARERIPVRSKSVGQAELSKRARQAERCWWEATSIEGTAAETYLREARGITCPLPNTLRFHPGAWHGPTVKKVPALVALIQGGDSYAVHRTFLLPDGSGKVAVQPNKMMLGATAGGAVRLSRENETLVVGEGIESTLSLLCGLFSRPAMVWAALSTSGLRGLRLPPVPGRLTIAQDGDKAGRAAAHGLAERAYAAGWKVSLLDPGDGLDFNDVLRREEAL